MAQRKASQVDGFVTKPDKNIALVLLYGPDQGLISERADKLVTNYGIKADDPMGVCRFDADDIGSDPGKLADEAYAISMFGGARIIRIKGSTRKNILGSIKPILENPPPECWIVFEGGDLKRDSGLRKLIEKSPAAMALPCYQDGASALEQLIGEEITSNNLSIDRDTKAYLKSLLGDDRRASRNELKKLALYAHGQDTISRDEIAALLGNVSAVENHDIIDAASLGRTDFLQTRFDQLISSGMAPDILIMSCLRHFQLLHHLRATMEANRSGAASLVGAARPPIHFSRRDNIIRVLGMWKLDKIEIALDRLNTAFYETRSKPDLARSIAATTLLAIALLAKRA